MSLNFSTTQSSIKSLLKYYGFKNLREAAAKNNITAPDDGLLAVKTFIFLCELYENGVEPN